MIGVPIVQSALPDVGDPGDRFTVTVKGDALTGVTRCDFGEGVICQVLAVVDDGTVRVKVSISSEAVSGPRDVILANLAGVSGRLSSGFAVL